MKKHHVFFIFLAIVVFSISCQEEQKKTEAPKNNGPKILKADAILAERSDVKQQSTSTGSFIAEDEVEISSEVSGYLKNIYFKEGDYKKKGELLAKINDIELQARRKKLEVDLKYAQQEIARAEKLLKIQALSVEEGDRLKNLAKVIEADIAIIDAQITQTSIYAPFSGRIGIKMKSEGAYLSPGVGIAELHKINPIKLEFFVPEKLAGSVTQGDKIQFTVPSQQDTFEASIYLVSPNLESENRSLRMRCRVPNSKGIFMPGGYADIYYDIQGDEGSLLIPAEAIIPILDGQKVLIAKNGKVKSQKVEVGMRTPSAVQILGGITDTDTILVTGILSATDGMLVEANLKSR
ncbi:efflux RND transporter periplasmic adaptor subunit [Portibacter lacus]|uniref:MexH family multidrug efflux RND transporter periplasmic adaptor subunit n=1 Tax=Portibacter lacus TaxID=1099794 RepID=A0AA37WET1_9BACT|nr:efflux RND transporter periplasmic adaptor subunit [Portibacter lacus]GLR16979.1 MexH family multidrug efflux RND transporter periplasmic adaptor subunit [Portibacter lacus]